MYVYEIIDDNGVIHSGDEVSMMTAFDVMTHPERYTKEQIDLWQCEWSGDLKLVHIIARYR